MGDQDTEGRSFEDWHAVMEALLHGPLEQQQLASFRLNRLLSGFLHRLDAWNYADAWEDLRQTVMIKLMQRYQKPPLPKPEAFVSYALQTTRNAFVDFLHKQPSPKKEGSGRPAADPVGPFPPSGLDPATRLSLQACLDTLPPDLRAVVDARYFGDLKLDDAAAATGLGRSTFKRRLQDALERLRACLADQLPQRQAHGKE